MEKLNNYLEARKIIFQESVRVVKRDPEKYLKMILGIWVMPLMIRGTGMVKDAYFFMRHIDDVLDGDLPLNRDPLVYVESIREDVASGSKNNEISVLARRSLDVLNKKKKQNEDPKKYFLTGIDGMINDHSRMMDKKVLLENELRQNHIDSFGPHHNISLMGVDSDLRAKDIEIFSYCQGLAYGLQDFETDWQRGLVNIPREVLDLSGMTISNLASEVKSDLIVRDWVISETEKSRVDLGRFLENLNDMSGEKSAKLLLNSLSRRVVKILEEPIF